MAHTDTGRGQDAAADAVKVRALRSIADLADGAMAEQVRMEAAARILTIARRALLLRLHAAATPAVASAGSVVSDLALVWDPNATTATEFLEALPVPQLDAFLAAARGWAASVQAANSDIVPDYRKVA